MTLAVPVKSEKQACELEPFEELFKLHHRKVYALCLRMTGDMTEAEDLSQEVFLQIFRKLDTFRGDSAFTTWIYRMTVNQVLMHFRKKKTRKEQLTEAGELPEQALNGRNVLKNFPVLDRLALHQAMVKLSPGYRAVFMLHDVEGLEHTEIAKILGCSVGTSKSQLHKARLTMRRLLRSPDRPGQTARYSGQMRARFNRLLHADQPFKDAAGDAIPAPVDSCQLLASSS
jgi:RNA polymerase sigma-70 factor (ECF subfamily)